MTPASDRHGTGWWPWAPAIVGVVAVWAILLISSTPALDIIRYTLYAALAVALPGTLLFRSIVGQSRCLLSDVAWGGVVGLIWELAGWVVLTPIALNSVMWCWPLLTVATFATVPRLRRHLRRSVGSERTPPVFAWGVLAAVVLSLGYQAITWFRTNLPPPSGVQSFVDLPWHLGVAYEAQRGVIPQTVEATVEGTLHYHFLADAHFGIAGLISGVDPAIILVRLWVPLLTFLAVATTGALALKITRSGIVAGLSAVMVVALTSGLDLWNWTFQIRVIYPDSPTAVFAVGIAALAIEPIVDIVRGHQVHWRRWALLAVTLFVAVGSKPSIVPDLLGGVGLAFLLSLLRRPRRWGPILAVGVLLVGAIGLSVPLFASASGSKPGFLAIFAVFGSSLSTEIAAFVVQSTKGYLLLLSASAAMLIPRVRRDPAAYLLAGIVAGGLLLSWSINHPGRSELFFWNTAIPFACILSAWALTVLVRQVPRRRLVGLSVLALAVTGAGQFYRFHSIPPRVVRPGLIILALIVLVIVVAAMVLRIRLLTALIVGCVASVSSGIPAALANAAVSGLPTVPYRSSVYAETQAARWVEHHTPVNALFVTNSHCFGRMRLYCDARQFWLSGFGGRRVLLGGYGVSPSQLAISGRHGQFAWKEPYHNQALLKLNDAAVNAPTAKILADLHNRYGVGWIAADSSTSPVSPHLRDLATLRYSNGVVQIFQLK